MNRGEVDRQINQMVDFILQEAKEKAHEIATKAEEEFNMEKLLLVEQAKTKLRDEFEKKKKNVEIQKRIAYSNEVNSNRMSVLRKSDDIIADVLQDVTKHTYGLPQGSAQYKQMTRNLVLQGLYHLLEDKVVVRCRECDAQIVNSVIADAKKEFESQTKRTVDVQLDNKNRLAPAPVPGVENGNTCAGGVVLQSADGRITCDNTLDARISIVFNQQLPEIKKGLFGASATRVHID